MTTNDSSHERPGHWVEGFPPKKCIALIPPLVWEALDKYIRFHQPTGGFLRALLTNDLRETVFRADDNSFAALKPIILVLYNYAQGGCYGSQERYQAWVECQTPDDVEAMQRLDPGMED